MILSTESVGESEEIHGKKYSTKIFTTDIQYYIFTLNFFILLMIYWGMTTWISTFLVKQHGLDLKTMGLYAVIPYLVAGFAMWFCRIYCGYFPDGHFKIPHLWPGQNPPA